MEQVQARIAADPARVWAVLADGWLYTGWVVGASHIRDVDHAWPGVGAKLHHSVGVWPLTISDYTQVRQSVPQRLLVLRARAWPLGEARVELALAPDDGGTLVTMREWVTRGPGRYLPGIVRDLLLRQRNRESVARLRSMAENREATAAVRPD